MCTQDGSVNCLVCVVTTVLSHVWSYYFARFNFGVSKIYRDNRYYGLFTLHGTGTWTGNETGNDGFLYYAMYCSHYTGTGNRTGSGGGDGWVPYPFLASGPVLGNAVSTGFILCQLLC